MRLPVCPAPAVAALVKKLTAAGQDCFDADAVCQFGKVQADLLLALLQVVINQLRASSQVANNPTDGHTK